MDNSIIRIRHQQLSLTSRAWPRGSQTTAPDSLMVAWAKTTVEPHPYPGDSSEFDDVRSLFICPFVNRNRYYHAQLVRFISRDPIGYESDLSLMHFLMSRPTVQTDPMGLWAIPIATRGGCLACLGPGGWYCGDDAECWGYFFEELPAWHKAACATACAGCAIVGARAAVLVIKAPKGTSSLWGDITAAGSRYANRATNVSNRF